MYTSIYPKRIFPLTEWWTVKRIFLLLLLPCHQRCQRLVQLPWTNLTKTDIDTRKIALWIFEAFCIWTIWLLHMSTTRLKTSLLQLSASPLPRKIPGNKIHTFYFYQLLPRTVCGLWQAKHKYLLNKWINQSINPVPCTHSTDKA